MVKHETPFEILAREWYEKRYGCKLERKTTGCDYTLENRPVEMKSELLRKNQVNEMIEHRDGIIIDVERNAIMVFILTDFQRIQTSKRLEKVEKKVPGKKCMWHSCSKCAEIGDFCKEHLEYMRNL